MVTTNLEEHELEDQIGERVVSRLVEMCGDPLPLFDDDRRMRVSADVPELARRERRLALGRWIMRRGLDPLDH